MSETAAELLNPPAEAPLQPVRRKKSPWRPLAFIGLVVVLGFVLYAWLDAIGGPQEVSRRYGPAAAAFLVPTHAVIAVSPLPGEAVAVANGMIFGFWVGAVLNWIGWMFAAALQYGLIRRTAEGFEFDPTSRKMPGWLRRIPVDHPLFLITGRWIPFGGHLVNTSAGAYAVPIWRHMWCSGISLIPVSMLFSGLANGLLHLLPL